MAYKWGAWSISVPGSALLQEKLTQSEESEERGND